MPSHAVLRHGRYEGHPLRAEHAHDAGRDADKHALGQQVPGEVRHLEGRMPRDEAHDPRARTARNTNP